MEPGLPFGMSILPPSLAIIDKIKLGALVVAVKHISNFSISTPETQ